jgi:hypothetical protein
MISGPSPFPGFPSPHGPHGPHWQVGPGYFQRVQRHCQRCGGQGAQVHLG